MLICTALNATTSAAASIASARRAAGTVATVTSRCSCWTRNGNSVEVNSSSGTITRAPSGSEAATSPTKPDTVAPIATRAAGTPTISANAARAPSLASPQCSQPVRPPRQSASAACIA